MNNFNQNIQNLYNIYKILLKENKEDLNKRKDSPFNGMADLIQLRWQFYPQNIQKYNECLSKSHSHLKKLKNQENSSPLNENALIKMDMNAQL